MSESDTLLVFLATQDAPCPVCSYNLRGLQTTSPARCPECGAELHLRVGSENLRIGPWLLAIISLTMAVGFDAVVLVILAIGASLSKNLSPADIQQIGIMLGTFLGLTLTCGGGILLILRKRRQWCLIARPTQWRIAAATFLVVFIIHALVGGFLSRIL
jgi:hypothetical protein